MANKYIPLGKRIVWEGYKTPINDANLNNIEQRIQNISDYLAASQETGAVLGKGTIIGDTLRDTEEDTYLSIQEEDIDIAKFNSKTIHLFYNNSTKKYVQKILFSDDSDIPSVISFYGNMTLNDKPIITESDLLNKLDKVTETNNSKIAYTVNENGEQESSVLAHNAYANTIMYRDTNGRSKTKDPFDDEDISNKRYTDTKLEKDTSTANELRCYTIETDGTQTTKWASPTNYSRSIIFRDMYGRAEISEPIRDYEIANKKYVDDKINTLNFIVICEALPEQGTPNKIFLVPKQDAQNKDLFDEYLWTSNGWEWVTTKQIDIDLTPYATKEFAEHLIDIDEIALTTMLKEVLV